MLSTTDVNPLQQRKYTRHHISTVRMSLYTQNLIFVSIHRRGRGRGDSRIPSHHPPKIWSHQLQCQGHGGKAVSSHRQQLSLSIERKVRNLTLGRMNIQEENKTRGQNLIKEIITFRGIRDRFQSQHIALLRFILTKDRQDVTGIIQVLSSKLQIYSQNICKFTQLKSRTA